MNPQYATASQASLRGQLASMSPNDTVPRRTSVGSLSSAIDRLEKTLAEHVERLDPILRPAEPALACGQNTGHPESRLASEVARIEMLGDRLLGITNRVEA